MEKLKLGIIGLSKGNGHPYSWSAIFNGYNPDYMNDCPWPVIPKYLSQQKFPEDQIQDANVTHIWTQDLDASEHIAKSSYIKNVVTSPDDMVGKVDAVLLARDDAENHYKMAKQFIEAGLPIFIDKPLALSINEANKIFDLSKFEHQIFSCSSLKYAREFQPEAFDLNSTIRMIRASVMKSWEKYAVHIIEPTLKFVSKSDKIVDITNTGTKSLNLVTVRYESGLILLLQVTGTTPTPLELTLFTDDSFKTSTFEDTYFAFKKSLEMFIKGIHLEKRMIPKQETLSVIEIIEKGMKQ